MAKDLDLSSFGTPVEEEGETSSALDFSSFGEPVEEPTQITRRRGGTRSEFAAASTMAQGSRGKGFDDPRRLDRAPAPAPAVKPYTDRREAIDDAINLIDEGADRDQVFKSFENSPIKITRAEIERAGAARGSPSFQRAPDVPGSVRPGAMEGQMQAFEPDASNVELAIRRGGKQIQGTVDAGLYMAGATSPGDFAEQLRKNRREVGALAPFGESAAGADRLQAANQTGSWSEVGAAIADPQNWPALRDMVIESAVGSGPTIIAGGLATALSGGTLGMPVAAAMSFAQEYTGALQGEMEKRGIDASDPVAVARVLQDPDFREAVDQRGRIRGAAVGAFDAISLGVASSIGRAMRKATDAGTATRGGIIGGAAAGGAAGMGLAASGEALGQAGVGDNDKLSIAIEALADAPGAAVDIAAGAVRKPPTAADQLAAAIDADAAERLAPRVVSFSDPNGPAAQAGVRPVIVPLDQIAANAQAQRAQEQEEQLAKENKDGGNASSPVAVAPAGSAPVGDVGVGGLAAPGSAADVGRPLGEGAGAPVDGGGQVSAAQPGGAEQPAALSSEPAIWTGRSGNGYATSKDAEVARTSKQRASDRETGDGRQWSIVPTPEGRFKLEGRLPAAAPAAADLQNAQGAVAPTQVPTTQLPGSAAPATETTNAQVQQSQQDVGQAQPRATAQPAGPALDPAVGAVDAGRQPVTATGGRDPSGQPAAGEPGRAPEVGSAPAAGQAASLAAGLTPEILAKDIATIEDGLLRVGQAAKIEVATDVNDPELADLAAAMRSPMYFVRVKSGKASFGGVAVDGRIAINANAKNAPVTIVMHESIHTMPPKIRQALIEKVIADLVPEGREKFLARYKAYKGRPEKIDEEIVAKLSENAATEPAFWENVREKLGDSDFKGVVKHILATLDRLIKRGANYDNRGLVKDWEKTRANIADAVARTMRGDTEWLDNISEADQAPDSMSGVEVTEVDDADPDAARGAGGNFSLYAKDFDDPADRVEVSTTVPTGKPKKGQPASDAVEQKWIIDAKSITSIENHAAKVEAAIQEYNAVKPEGQETGIEALHRIVVDNLVWLHNKMPEGVRARSKLWYDGANKIAEGWAEEFKLDVRQVAGVLAVLSPQKDWFMNVTLGERVIRIFKQHNNEPWSPAMTEWVKSYVAAAKTLKDRADRTKMLDVAKRLEGKTLEEMSDVDGAYFVRVFDETFFPRQYRVVTPEGGFGGFVTNGPEEVDADADVDDTSKQGSVAWGSYPTIVKALSILRNGERANIFRNVSEQLGQQHKVRNFYNNIVRPGSADGHVTIDTHAVAAAFIKALSGSSREVLDNFGVAGGNNVTGASGTYGVFADAYREAAAQVGILPREMQSIAWEAVRSIFQPSFKTKRAKDVEVVWDRYKAGEITREQARDMVVEMAGDIKAMAWESTPEGAFVQEGGKSFDSDIASSVANRAVRKLEPFEIRDKARATLTAATTSIEGIKRLYQKASKGDAYAHALIQDIGVDNLKFLLAGTSSKIKVDRATGLYGGYAEPSLGIDINFQDSERGPVLAALAKFASNFNQEQIHVRQETSDEVGTVYEDGSYVTPTMRWELKEALPKKKIEEIIKKSGLFGLTFGGDFVEAYYVGDPGDGQAIENFRLAISKADKLVGSSSAKNLAGSARLWAYGRGDGVTQGYAAIEGDVRAGAPGPSETAKRVAAYLLAEPGQKPGKVTTFEQKKADPQQSALQREIARAFEARPINDMANPRVRKAYKELAKEAREQYEALPVKVEIFVGDDEPYANSDAMRNDILKNNHLFIYGTTPETYGQGPGDFDGHPLLDDAGISDANGKPMLANDLFRAVHDYYAHALSPTQFGPAGEEAAWKNHMSVTKSPWARWALTAETRGQNSWVNFRPQAEKIPAIKDRPFAKQKAILLPIEYSMTGDAKVDKPMIELQNILPVSQRVGSKPERELAPDADFSFDAGQPDLFPGEFANKRSTAKTSRLIDSRGRTAKGVNVNSSGKKITATKQGLQKFWDWFGNSEAVDDDGRPLVLYHSTNSDIQTLKTGVKTTNNYGILGDVELSRGGIFMTPNLEFSQEYLREGSGQNVMQLYARIENPIDLRSGLSETDEAALEKAGINIRYVTNIQNYWELFDNADDGSNDFVDGLKRAGYDGAIFREASPGGESSGGVTYVAFEPEQIKSATGNRGTFDPTDPRIDFSLDADQPFYSALSRAIDKGPGQAMPDQWRMFLKGLPAKGVKPDEITWSGIEDWLQLQTGKVSRDSVKAYLDANGVRVEETTLSDGGLTAEEAQELNELRDLERRANEGEDGVIDDAEIDRLQELEERKGGDSITRYGSYTLPGGTNYREVLLTLPEKTGRKSDREALSAFQKSMQAKYGSLNWRRDATREEIIENDRLLMADKASEATYKSGHWDQKNILAHIRLNDRTSADGRRVLFVEEIQSDWGQAGARKTGRKLADGTDERVGFSRGRPAPKVEPGERDALISLMRLRAQDKLVALGEDSKVTRDVVNRLGHDTLANASGMQKEYEDLLRREGEDRQAAYMDAKSPPLAPFVTATDKWLGLALKRVVKMAVDGGYDKVAFVTGDQSAERYDLSQRVRVIAYEFLPADTVGMLRAYDHSGTQIIERSAAPDELPDIVGKEIAQRLLEAPVDKSYTRSIEGNDLKVGGEGMKAFYDKIVPAAAKTLLKKIGGEMSTVGIKASDDKSKDKGWASGEEVMNWMGIAESEQQDFWGDLSQPERNEAMEAYRNRDAKEMTLQQPGFDITDKMRDEARGGLPLFSVDAEPDFARPANWQSPEPSGRLDNFIYAIQDKQIDTKRVMQELAKAGATINDRNNMYLREELYQGRVASRTEKFLEEEVKPLFVEMKAAGVSLEQLEEYLHARHAEERNIAMEAINPGRADNDWLSGMKTADANAILAKASPAMARLASRVDTMLEGTRQLMEVSGIEDVDTVDDIRNAYQAYVPLYRDEADGNGMPGAGQGFNVKGTKIKRATGSTKQVTNILAHIVAARENTITRAEKNVVALAVYSLAKRNPNDDFWTIEAPTENVLDTRKEIYNPGLKQMMPNPKYNTVISRTNPNWKNDPQVLVARINGKDVAVRFNPKDERATRMAQALKNLDVAQLDAATRLIAKATRWLAAVNTQYNPVFAIVNFTRDVQGAAVNLIDTPINGSQAQVIAGIPAAMRAVYRAEAGKTPIGNWAAVYAEFKRRGAKTGFKDSFPDIDARAEALQKEMARLNRGLPMRAAAGALDFLSDANDAIENAVRLSAYKVAIEKGITPDQAASLAKNLTVNFNRKGAKTQGIAAYYAFFNAAVQGNTRTLKALASKNGKYIIAGGIAVGVMQALLMSGMDDDEEEKIPDYIKRTSFILPMELFGGKGYVNIPLPLGLHVLPNIGRVMGNFAINAARGKDLKIKQSMVDVLMTTLDALNPFGSASDISQMITPTVADPIIQLASNKNFAGFDVYRERSSSDEGMPGYLLARPSTNPAYVEAAKAIHLLFNNGDPMIRDTNMSPMTSPQPEALRLIVETIGGGVWRETEKVVDAVLDKANDRKTETHRIPLVSRFYGELDSPIAEQTLFYKSTNKILAEGRAIKRSTKADEDRPDSVERQMLGQAKAARKEVIKLAARRRSMEIDGATPAEIEEVQTQMTERMRQFNEAYREAKKEQQ